LFPPGSEAERLSKLSPIGRDVEEIITSQAEELGAPWEDDHDNVIINADLLPAPAAKAPPAAEPEPELGESMKKLVSRPIDMPVPVVEQARSIYQPIKPLPEQDFGREYL
jgi:hypothetical protein